MTVWVQLAWVWPVMPMRVPRAITVRLLAFDDATPRTFSAVVANRWPTMVGSVAGFGTVLAGVAGRLLGLAVVAGVLGLESTDELGDLVVDGRAVRALPRSARSAPRWTDWMSVNALSRWLALASVALLGRVVTTAKGDGDDEGAYGDHDGRTVGPRGRRRPMTGCRHAGSPALVVR